MKKKPKHNDIRKYGYFLQYSPSRDCWYASYDTNKSTAWYKWDGLDFNLLMDETIPNDLQPST